MRDLHIAAVPGLPEVRAADDLAALIARHADELLQPGAIVCVAQKLVSKAEGRVRRLSAVVPSNRAFELARGGAGRGDARVVQLVLDESSELLRSERGVLICRTHSGLVCANAGVDRSNAANPDEAILLPADPDASARAIRGQLQTITGHAPLAVLISDSFGRAWRLGQVDVAIGLAGITPLDDHAGRHDRSGRVLAATLPATGDELAAAASLARTKDGGEGVVVIRGLQRHVTADDGPGAAALQRPVDEDLFR